MACLASKQIRVILADIALLFATDDMATSLIYSKCPINQAIQDTRRLLVILMPALLQVILVITLIGNHFAMIDGENP